MEHRFYSKGKRKQTHILILIAFCAFVVILLSIYISWKTEIYLIAIFTVPVVLSIIAPFFDTPSLKKSGHLTYYSPLFLTEKPKNGVVIIHGGTLFDYVFVIEKNMNGRNRTNLIMQQYVQGLLFLIEDYENKKIGNLTVRGTSYIINERTAGRIGFKNVKTDFIQKLILAFNFFNVLLMYSIAKDKLAFPNLNHTKTFETQLNALSERKEYLIKLNNKLKSTIDYMRSESIEI